MSQVIPLKIKQQLKNNLANNIANNVAKKNMNRNLHRGFVPASFIMDPKSLLPILFIFRYGKKSSNFALLQNILNPTFGLNKLFSGFNFSSDNIQKSLNMLNTINQFTSPQNSIFLNRFSTVLETLYKFSTIESLSRDLFRNPENQTANNTDNITDKFNLNNLNPEATIKMIDAVSNLMNENSRKNIQKVKGVIHAVNKFKDMSNRTKNSNNDSSFNLDEIISAVKPLLSSEYINTLESIYSIIKMADLLSILDEFENSSDNNEKSSENSKNNTVNTKNILSLISSLSDKTRDLEEKNIIDIEDYDEEDDFNDKNYEEIAINAENLVEENNKELDKYNEEKNIDTNITEMTKINEEDNNKSYFDNENNENTVSIETADKSNVTVENVNSNEKDEELKDNDIEDSVKG